MTPAKPLPIDVPVTSTNWPGTKCAAVISAPTSIRFSGLTRNSATLRFGSTSARAKCPRSAFGVPFGLRVPDAELNGGVAVLLRGALRHHLAIVDAQHRHRHVLAGLGVDAGHPQLLCNHA